MEFIHRCLVVALYLLPVPAAAVPFTRGDVDQGGRIDVSDAILILEKLFSGGQGSCDDAADVDDDGTLTVSDPIYLLGALFRGGPAPPAPFPACGEDPTDDGLSCEAFEACGFTFDFYSLELSGDAVFFVIDKSRRMLELGELALARMQVRSVLEEMPDGIRFAIIFFDEDVTRFPSGPEPAVATSETKASAMAFVNGTAAGATTCGRPALHSALDSARLSGARRNLVLYLSDGSGACRAMEEAIYLRTTLEDVTRANAGLTRIYTVEVLNEILIRNAFMKGLAEQNGGVTVKI